MFEVACGSLETMQKLAKKGLRALNPKTMRYQVIDKNAVYEARYHKTIKDTDGNDCVLGLLFCDVDLHKIAKVKGLIM